MQCAQPRLRRKSSCSRRSTPSALEVIPHKVLIPGHGQLDRNGSAIHEHGTCRMGEDPKRSAPNKFNQMHEVKNLFVADAAPFVSNADKNPTHTIVALAWRTAEYLAEELRKGNV